MASFALLVLLATIVQCSILLHPPNIDVHDGMKVCSRKFPAGFSIECKGIQGPVMFVVNGQPAHTAFKPPYIINDKQLARSWGVEEESKFIITCLGSGSAPQSTIINFSCNDVDSPTGDTEKEQLDGRRVLHGTLLPNTHVSPTSTPNVTIGPSPEVMLSPSPDLILSYEHDTSKGIILVPLHEPAKSEVDLRVTPNICASDYLFGFAIVCRGDIVGPVLWTVNGVGRRIETVPPYSLAGDFGELLRPYTPSYTDRHTVISCSSRDGTNYTVNVDFHCYN